MHEVVGPDFTVRQERATSLGQAEIPSTGLVLRQLHHL